MSKRLSAGKALPLHPSSSPIKRALEGTGTNRVDAVFVRSAQQSVTSLRS
jgi:hypothetical protein